MVARAGEASVFLQAGSQGEQDAGDHKGPPNRPSSTLAPTDRPASFLTSQLSLMDIG